VCVALAFSACGDGAEFNNNATGDAGAGAEAGGDSGGSPSTAGSNQTGGSLIGSGGDAGGTAPEGGMNAGGEPGAGGAPTPPECATPADCDTARGPSACGVWACNSGSCEIDSPGCSDDDGDSYGFGASCACAGLDCDDADATVTDSLQQSCYTGPNGTAGVGACQQGQAICTAGIWGPCVGEVTPGGEACNGLDDDCNGSDDDGLGNFSCGLGACTATIAACTGGALAQCVPHGNAAANDSNCNKIDDDCDGAIDEDCACVRVSPIGNDALADGATVHFLTVQAAINWAVSHPNGPQQVCISSGAACGTTATYTSPANQTITMANGISVFGKYQHTTWARCPTSTTVLQPSTAAGVTFPDSVVSTTVLDGVRVDRYNASTTAGVTIDGATDVILSDVSITNTPIVTNSYAVNVINGAQATITRGHTDAGFGTSESIGIRAVGSTVSIEDNCLSPDPVSGRCDDFCGSNPSVRGRTSSGTGTTYAVLLDDSPGSRVQRSALCANDADIGAAIKVTGDATGVLIRGNVVNAFGGAQDSHGIWLEDCGGAAPWIVDNNYIAVAGDSQQTRVDAIRSIGDCHPVIDRNVNVTGGGEGQASNPTAVHCAASGGTPSRCVVDGNLALRGSEFGYPPVAAGVRCEGGSCVKITGNTITGRGGQSVSYGIWLGQTGAYVANNVVRGGCSATSIGVYAEDSYARLENNRVFGYVQTDCTNNPPVVSKSYGLQVFSSDGPNEIDVHSNFLDGTGTSSGSCDSWGVALNVTGTPPTAPSGMFRNNIFRAGMCTQSRSSFAELVAAADPRIFEHNDFDPANTPTTLYLDEGNSPLATVGAVNALIDMTVFGNISVDPQFVTYPTDLHLSPGSLCDGAGTSNGAPALDMDGAARDPATPDIGPDER
jgi:hypothetical protein